jgi:tape measure domain-containing protein
MPQNASRRDFLAAGLVLPAAAAVPGVETPKTPAMRYRILGKTGLKVSELGCGCEAVSDISVLQRAADLGINFFDTARSYEGGGNERFVAAALKGRRNSVVLSTRSYAGDAKSLQRDLDVSLKELALDHVDLWYIGNKDTPEELTDDMLEVQHAAQKAGKVRFRALSTHRISAMVPFILDKGRFDVVQIPYNFAVGSSRNPSGEPGGAVLAQMQAKRAVEPRDVNQLTEAGLPVWQMIAGKLGKSFPETMKLVEQGKVESKDVLPAIRAGIAHISADEALAKLNQAGVGAVAMKVMAGGYRQRVVGDAPSACTAALRWALKNQHIQTTSVRMTSHDQVDENIQAAVKPYSDADAKILHAHLERIRPVYCRMCGSCDGKCPKGLPVADLVRFVTYAEGYGEFPMGYERFRSLPEELRQIRCTDCRECAAVCPNGVRIREQTARAQALFC